MKNFVLGIYSKFEKIIKYLSFSIISTVIDMGVVWICYESFGMELSLSNTLGVVIGFFISYILSVKKVFDARTGFWEFLIYFVTFLGGLVLANYLITTVNGLMLLFVSKGFAFLLAKGVSVVVPFFAMYFARKYLYLWLNKINGKV